MVVRHPASNLNDPAFRLTSRIQAFCFKEFAEHPPSLMGGHSPASRYRRTGTRHSESPPLWERAPAPSPGHSAFGGRNRCLGAGSPPWDCRVPPPIPLPPERTLRPPMERDLLPSTRNRRSEEHTSELQSLMRISYACFCL